MKRTRKGQSEVIGGLIVLTVLFMFAIPVIMNAYYSIIQTGQEVKASLTTGKKELNEKLSIAPVNPYNALARKHGWIPGVWINNTGTVSVRLDKLYLVDIKNNKIYKVYDLTYARPWDNIAKSGTPDIAKMILDVNAAGEGINPPGPGQPITLQPGENLLIVFDSSLLSVAKHLIVLVESYSGIIYPIVNNPTLAQTLYPSYPPNGAGTTSETIIKGSEELEEKGTYLTFSKKSKDTRSCPIPNITSEENTVNVEEDDIDGNGINETVFSEVDTNNAYIYMLKQDITGASFVKVTSKITVYRGKTQGNSGGTSQSDSGWAYIVLWKYDDTSQQWIVNQCQLYVLQGKPSVASYQITGVLLLDETQIYRVGIAIIPHDNSIDEIGIEYLIAEQGIYLQS